MEQRKKVLITNLYFQKFTGSELHVLEFAHLFKEKGYDVVIAVYKKSYPLLQELEEGITVIECQKEALKEMEFEIVFIQHFPVFDYLVSRYGLKYKRMVVSKLSVINAMENLPVCTQEAAFILCVSPECADIVAMQVPEGTKIRVFQNCVEAEYFEGSSEYAGYKRALDKIAIISNHIPQELNRYVGDYHHFEEVYAVKKAQLEAAYRRQQQEISELKDFVARNKARVSTRNMAMSRQKKLDKMDVIELAAERPKPEFKFRYGRTPGRYIFETKDLVIGYDEPLSKPLSLSMERGQKIALVGANGIGKTTLLKSILGLIPAISGTCELGENLQIGYFEQEVKGDNRTTCIEEIWQEFPSFTQYEVRSALAKCGLTTKHIESQVRVLSGGEQAKVRLCKLVNRDTNILLLDEPTNHLDVDAKDSLKKALLDYRGSVLLICHEPEFYQDVVHAVWDCSKWTTKQI